MTKVSTITPCYNMARYMEGFLVNLAEQTYEDLEIVLDHNNPTDEEVAMVQSYNEIMTTFSIFKLMVSIQLAFP